MKIVKQEHPHRRVVAVDVVVGPLGGSVGGNLTGGILGGLGLLLGGNRVTPAGVVVSLSSSSASGVVGLGLGHLLGFCFLGGAAVGASRSGK